MIEERLESIAYNSPLYILGGALLCPLLFIGTREIIFHLFYFYDEISRYYSWHNIKDITESISIYSWASFVFHGVGMFFYWHALDNKHKIKAWIVITHLAIICIAYIVYLFFLVMFLSNPI